MNWWSQIIYMDCIVWAFTLGTFLSIYDWLFDSCLVSGDWWCSVSPPPLGVTRLDDQIFINRNPGVPSVVKFHPFNPCIAVADKDSIWWETYAQPLSYIWNTLLTVSYDSVPVHNALLWPETNSAFRNSSHKEHYSVWERGRHLRWGHWMCLFADLRGLDMWKQAIWYGLFVFISVKRVWKSSEPGHSDTCCSGSPEKKSVPYQGHDTVQWRT